MKIKLRVKLWYNKHADRGIVAQVGELRHTINELLTQRARLMRGEKWSRTYSAQGCRPGWSGL